MDWGGHNGMAADQMKERDDLKVETCKLAKTGQNCCWQVTILKVVHVRSVRQLNVLCSKRNCTKMHDN